MNEFCQHIRGSRFALPGGSVLAVVVLVFAFAFVGGETGCYNPKVLTHTLRCAQLPAKQCPDGFACVNGLCDDAEAGTGGAGRGGVGGAGGAGGAGGIGGACANAIVPSCPVSNAAPAVCDPVCQRGCGCGLRCTVTATGAGCVATSGAKKVGQVCNPKSDECAAGSVCLPEPCGTNLGRCYKFCRDSSDCGGGGIVCGMPVQLPQGGPSGLRACNLGDQTPACDPVGQSGCPDVALACYATGQTTKCDCPGPANGQETQACTFPNDCAPGLTCLSSMALAGPQCHKTCRTNADCTGAATCTASGTFGFCQ